MNFIIAIMIIVFNFFEKITNRINRYFERVKEECL